MVFSYSLCITARQPVGPIVFAQLQVGLDAVLSFTLQQLYLVFFHGLRQRLAERRQSHGVLMASGLYRGQVDVIEAATRIHRPDIGIAYEQPVRRAQWHQIAAEIDQRIGLSLYPLRLAGRLSRL